MKPPVLIVGAGPVGMITALLLDRLSVPSILIDKRSQLPGIPRAIHLDSEVLNILKIIGLDSFVDNQVFQSKGLFLFNKKTKRKFLQASLNFNKSSSSFLFDQHHLETALLSEINKSINISLRYDYEFIQIKEQNAELLVHDQLIDQPFSYLIGADGANSKVVEVANIKYTKYPFQKTNYKVDYITSDQPSFKNRIEKYCSKKDSYVRMAFKNRVRVELTNYRDNHLNPPVSLIEGITNARIKKILHADKYHFNSKIANKWFKGRILIAGDAAHTMPPYIGEGLCNGIRDAFNIGWKVAYCYFNGYNDILLNTYQKERKSNVTKYLALTLLTGFLFTTSLKFLLKPFELLGYPLKINQSPIKKGRSDLIKPDFDLLANAVVGGNNWAYLKPLYNSFTIISSIQLSDEVINELTQLFSPFTVNYYSSKEKISKHILGLLNIKKVESIIIRPDLSVLFKGNLNKASREKIQRTLNSDIIS